MLVSELGGNAVLHGCLHGCLRGRREATVLGAVVLYYVSESVLTVTVVRLISVV
ncbi:hypothetical protein ACFV7R_13945 [Streptomyces sp. NPDC059866]|uniref:hypothetical protein n=1 Tax=Streptomyces sp. NPDC059866 TaxID=3346978 RepID=UPI0036647C67